MTFQKVLNPWILGRSFVSLLLVGFLLPLQVLASSEIVSILHTNDLHSHFRPNSGPLQLGGVARLKTLLNKLRHELPHTILVDGGDWSEGNIYYTHGVLGSQSIRMMDHLGYAIAVIGNHDWLNGPQNLIDSFNHVQPKLSFVSANLSAEGFSGQAEFEKWVLPYKIQKVGSVNIAFIGISTYEWVYDKFFGPIKILEPIEIANKLASALKSQVDFVVVISHNSVSKNVELLKRAPDVGLVVGAHDHRKLTKPVVVKRPGYPNGWVVEAGSWGQYLGQVDLEVLKDQNKVKLSKYQLHQLDNTIQEDPETLQRIDQLEIEMEKQLGPVFHDHVGISEIEIEGHSIESPMGNLVTDAFRSVVPEADFALESTKFIYGDLHPGPLKVVDFFNAYGAVYNPQTKKSWTIKKLSMTGRQIKWLLYLLYASDRVSSLGLMSASGLEFDYDSYSSANKQDEVNPIDPWLLDYFYSLGGPNPADDWETKAFPVVQNIRIGGKPLDTHAVYTVAAGQGIIESIEFVNTHFFKIVSLEDLLDTEKEQWRVLAGYVRDHSPLTLETVKVGDRIRPLKADLYLYDHNIRLVKSSKQDKGLLATLEINLKNRGKSPSPEDGVSLNFYRNKNGSNLSLDEDLEALTAAHPISRIEGGESRVILAEVFIPEVAGKYPVTFKVQNSNLEGTDNNQGITKWF